METSLVHCSENVGGIYCMPQRSLILFSANEFAKVGKKNIKTSTPIFELPSLDFISMPV